MQIKMRGILVAFEGLDSVGKTTQISLLQQRFEAEVFKFPNRSTAIGKILDKHLKKEHILNDKAEHLLLCANRAEFEPHIQQTIAEGKICILDRFLGSGAAYTSAKTPQNFNFESKDNLFKWSKKGDDHLILPDLTFYLHSTHPYPKDTNEIYETTAFQREVKIIFEKLAEENSWKMINVDQYWKNESGLNDLLAEAIQEKQRQIEHSPTLAFNDCL